MRHSESVAVLITVLFAVVGLYCLLRTATGFSWIDRVSNAVHVLMSLVMALMPWGPYAVIPAAAQITFFSLAALWYAYLALFDPHADAGPGESHHRGPALIWYHAGMMAAMVWMAVAMTPMSPSMSMGGMDMSGMQMPTAGGAMAMTGSTSWAMAVAWVLGGCFILATAWFLVRLVRQAVVAEALRGRTLITILDSAVSALMAAGMALTFLVLMT